VTDKSTVRQEIAADTMIGAAILLVTSGVLHILQGIDAIGNDQVFVVITERGIAVMTAQIIAIDTAMIWAVITAIPRSARH